MSLRVTTLSLAVASVLSPAVYSGEAIEITINSGIQPSPNEVAPGPADQTRVLPADGGEFLDQINGISASRFGGRGLEPVVRGQSQTQLNVILDGAYVHGGCPNRMDPPASWAALETYERVVVEKGVQTLQHGSGGSGGTVLFDRATHLLTKPDGGLQGKVAVTGMSNGVQHDVSADVTGNNDMAYARVFAQDRTADNYEDGDGEEVRSSYDHRQAGLVLGLTPSEQTLIEYTIERNDFEDALYPGAGMDSPEETGTIHRLKYLDEFEGAVKTLEASLYLSDIDHVMDNYSLRTANPMMLRETVTTSKTTGGKLLLTSDVGKTEILYGLNIQNRERDAVLKNINTGTDLALMWPGATTDQSGVFVEAKTPVGSASSLKYGVRVDRVEAAADKADQSVSALPTANQAYNNYYGVTADDVSETNVGALLRYEHALSAQTSLFTGLSRTVRTADETERYINKWGVAGSRWVGNPALEPEKHVQLDLGVAQKKGHFSWNGSLFFDKVSDFILRDNARGQAGILLADGSTIYRNVDAELTGLELEAEQRLSTQWTITGQLAYVMRENTTDDRDIAQTPPLNGKVQIDYQNRSWALGSRVRFADAQTKVDLLSSQEIGESPGYGVVDVYGRYQFNKNVKARFGIDNIFDKTYANHINRADGFNDAVRVNEPGMNVWAKLQANF